jgi:hypothetical protein
MDYISKLVNTKETEEINEVLFADDQMLIYENIEDLQNHLDRLSDFSTQYNMKINTSKTEVMTISKDRHKYNNNGDWLKQVSYSYRPPGPWVTYRAVTIALHFGHCTARSFRS